MGTQVLFLLQGSFWGFCLCLGQLQSPGERAQCPGQRLDRPEASELSPDLCSPAAWLTKMELSSAPSRRPAIAPASCRALLPSVPRASCWTLYSPSTERPSMHTRWSWLPAATTSGEHRSRGTGQRGPTQLRGSELSASQPASPARMALRESGWCWPLLR